MASTSGLEVVVNELLLRIAARPRLVGQLKRRTALRQGFA